MQAALQIVYLDPATLAPNPRNARVHPEAQIELICGAIRKVGFVRPIAHAAGVILAGHGGQLAALRMGLTSVPTVDLSHLTDIEQREYMLADNGLAARSKWDEALLKLEVTDLAAMGVDLTITGLAKNELDRMLRPEFNDADRPAPGLPDVARSRVGDTWLLGAHRIRCGDSCSAESVAQLLAGAEPNLMVTDPPYGVNYDPGWRNTAARTSAGMGNRAIGAGALGVVSNDDRADWREAWALFPGAVAYVWHGGNHGQEVAASLVAAGFVIRAQIIWVKPRAVISRGAYHWSHEPAFYAGKAGLDDGWSGDGEPQSASAGDIDIGRGDIDIAGPGPVTASRFEPGHEEASYSVRAGARADWHGGRRQTTVWTIDNVRNDTGHSTQKPIECMRRPILNNSRKGDAVYDPFLGSGTTLAAAEQTGRRCFASELDPRYIDVAVVRWQGMTGEAAVRESDGARFDELEPECPTS